MNDPVVTARVMEYRKLTAADAKEEAARLGLSPEEKWDFLFTADSNAIWDAQEGRAYTKPLYTPRAPSITAPTYDELGFLSDEDYKRITGNSRKK